MGSLGLSIWSTFFRSIFDRITGHFWVAPVLVMELCVLVILACFRVQSPGFQDLRYWVSGSRPICPAITYSERESDTCEWPLEDDHGPVTTVPVLFIDFNRIKRPIGKSNRPRCLVSDEGSPPRGVVRSAVYFIRRLDHQPREMDVEGIQETIFIDSGSDPTNGISIPDVLLG